MKLGEFLSEMTLYGDICEAPFPEGWPDEQGMNEEQRVRSDIAATFLAIMNGTTCGSCYTYDKLIAPFLNMELDLPIDRAKIAGEIRDLGLDEEATTELYEELRSTEDPGLEAFRMRTLGY